MKRYLTLLGFVCLTSYSLHASSINKKPADTANKSKSAVDPSSKYSDEVLSLNRFSDRDEVAFFLETDYVGGYLQADGIDLGVSGADSLGLEPPIQGSPASPKICWGNGIRTTFVISSAINEGRSFGFSYTYLTSTNILNEVSFTESTGNITPSLPTNVATGSRESLTYAAEQYSTPYWQRAAISYSRGLFMTKHASLALRAALDMLFFKQSLKTHYVHDDNGIPVDLYYNLNEKMSGAGPQLGFDGTLLLSPRTGIRNILSISMPVMTHKSYQTNRSQELGQDTEFSLNTAGSSTRLNNVVDFELVLFYRSHNQKDAKNNGESDGMTWEVNIGWASTFAPNLSLLTSVPGVLNGDGMAVSMSALTTGLAIIF